MRIKLYLLFIIFISLSSATNGQDIHFSQAFASPLTFNPAATGNFKGQYRLICNYKDQWRSISNTYKTVFASADFVLVKKKKKGSFLGAGLLFYNDKSGKAKMGTTVAGISLAYDIKLDKFNFLAAGIQSGFAQKSINTTGLKWNNQFDGTAYDPTLSSGEISYNEKVSYLDFSAGLLWNYVPNDKNRITAGVSLFHLNRPNQSFSNNTDPLIPKIVIHGDGQLKIGEKDVFLIPMALYTNQGKLKEINAGGMVKYGIGLDSKYTGANVSSTISLGALYRFKDALIILMNIGYKNIFVFGLSYDLNLSGLTNASRGRGGMELCIVYSGFFSKK